MVMHAYADKKRTDGMEQETDVEWVTPPQPSESDGGKVSWVLNEGLRLGKRILVAGFVVSAVPVVLPPLAVVSAIGIAFSLPYGFYLASYACTEKLMNKLLPVPTPADYGLISDQDERQDQLREDYGAGGGGRYLGESGLEGVLDVDKEENQQMKMEETRTGDDMRMELAEPEEESDVAARNDDGRGPVERGAEMQPLDYGVVHPGNAEDGSRTEESPSDVQINSVRQDEADITVAGNITGERRRTGTEGMVITVESNVETTPLVVDEFRECGMKDEELERETKGLLEKMRDESKGDQMHEPLDQILQGGEDSGGMEEGKQAVKEEEKSGEQMEAVKSDADQTQMEISDSTGGGGGGGSKGGKNRKKSKKSKVKSRESLESSVVARNKNNISIGVKVGHEVKCKTVEVREEEKPHLKSASTLQGGMETLEEAHRDEDEDDSVVANEKDMDSPSDEVRRRKIWEQIDAMRRIVGYKGPTHDVSYVEELKALYVFTGVEPPACFKDSTSDLADITHNLRFLMSIVGVK